MKDLDPYTTRSRNQKVTSESDKFLAHTRICNFHFSNYTAADSSDITSPNLTFTLLLEAKIHFSILFVDLCTVVALYMTYISL